LSASALRWILPWERRAHYEHLLVRGSLPEERDYGG
jgi:hypothetical protein